jgi:hypothetical protein
MTAPHERCRRYLETLTLETVDALPDYVINDVCFKDPFNVVAFFDPHHCRRAAYNGSLMLSTHHIRALR